MIFHQPHNSLSNYNYNAFFYTTERWSNHFHKNYELIYVVNGTVDCVVNNTAYTLKSGDFGLCLPYDIHSHTPRDDTMYWVLVFSEDFVRLFTKQTHNKVGAGFSFKCDTALQTYIEKHLIHNSSPSLLSLKSCLYAICEQYISSVPLADKNNKKTEVISIITDYIQSNHTKKLSLKSVSRQLGYDYNYMSRYFRKVFNMTFTEFVNIYRLETAIQLLDESDKSITDVAYESGFQSVRNFNCFFKKSMNVTPSQYKKARLK